MKRTHELDEREMELVKLLISNSTGLNERTHRSEFDTLRYVQCIPT